MRRNRAIDIYAQEVTQMYDCIYGRKGFCTIKRNMNCEADCSYYVEPERDDGRLTIVGDDNEMEEDDPMKKVFEDAVEANKKAMREINKTFKLFIEDLRKKYIDMNENNDDDNNKIGGTE
jgi:hypothetical protein